MESVIVFGGLGFIGRELIQRLSKPDRVVVCADNRSVEPEEESSADSVLDCDVCSPNSIRAILDLYRPKTIFWLAARQGYYADYSNFARTQCVGTYALFEAIDKVSDYQPERIVLSSSQAIYTPGRRVFENSEKRPPSVYGLSKLHQEKAFTWFCRSRDIACVALRYSIVLGAGQALQSTESGVIRNWWREWKRDRRGEVYGHGDQLRDFVHVKDVVESNILATYCVNSFAFNISGPELTILDAFRQWQELTGCRDAKILNHDVRPGGEYDMTSDSALANHILGWKSKFTFREMLQDFLDSAKGAAHTW